MIISTKNWTNNEHVGKIIQTHLVGTAGVVQPRVITSNTQTTITVATITTALVNGTGILLTVMIVYRLYEDIAQQHMMDMNPAMRKFIGGG